MWLRLITTLAHLVEHFLELIALLLAPILLQQTHTTVAHHTLTIAATQLLTLRALSFTWGHAQFQLTALALVVMAALYLARAPLERAMSFFLHTTTALVGVL
jgi:hypothetical protein